MTALAIDYGAIRIGEFHRVVVIDFSVLLAGTPCAASRTLYGYGVTTFHPVCHIDVENVQLYNVVAAKTTEIIPITHMVSHFCLFLCTWATPNAPAVPIQLSRHRPEARRVGKECERKCRTRMNAIQ